MAIYTEREGEGVFFLLYMCVNKKNESQMALLAKVRSDLYHTLSRVLEERSISTLDWPSFVFEQSYKTVMLTFPKQLVSIASTSDIHRFIHEVFYIHRVQCRTAYIEESVEDPTIRIMIHCCN